MKNWNKKQLFYWANIAFLMLNTAMFVYLLTDSHKSQEPIDRAISNEFLRQELQLTAEQYEQIKDIDKDAQEKYHIVLKLLCNARYRMLYEIAKPEPSVVELNKISASIGHLHQALKTQTFKHMLNLKKVCTPEQAKKLDDIFMEILEINKHCHSCPQKCTKQEKCKKCSKLKESKLIQCDSLQVE